MPMYSPSACHRAGASAATACIVSKQLMIWESFPETRPVSASPLSFVTAAVSSFSQISFYQSTYKNFVKDVNSEGILQL